ncbi:hypothetical protein ACFL16_00690 [Patescibacteria group bacterium]
MECARKCRAYDDMRSFILDDVIKKGLIDDYLEWMKKLGEIPRDEDLLSIVDTTVGIEDKEKAAAVLSSESSVEANEALNYCLDIYSKLGDVDGMGRCTKLLFSRVNKFTSKRGGG